jgi:hypothetical protein
MFDHTCARTARDPPGERGPHLERGWCCARVRIQQMGSPKTAGTNHIFEMIEIVVALCQPAPFPKRWAGLFEARLGDRLLCTSRQPFLDGARVLL